MKKQWLPIVFAAFLVLAPTVSASDGTTGFLEDLISQLVALLVGGDDPVSAPDGGQALNGEEPEVGFAWPPGG